MAEATLTATLAAERRRTRAWARPRRGGADGGSDGGCPSERLIRRISFLEEGCCVLCVYTSYLIRPLLDQAVKDDSDGNVESSGSSRLSSGWVCVHVLRYTVLCVY